VQRKGLKEAEIPKGGLQTKKKEVNGGKKKVNSRRGKDINPSHLESGETRGGKGKRGKDCAHVPRTKEKELNGPDLKTQKKGGRSPLKRGRGDSWETAESRCKNYSRRDLTSWGERKPRGGGSRMN